MDEGKNHALQNGLMFKETSAKEATNVDGILHNINTEH